MPNSRMAVTIHPRKTIKRSKRQLDRPSENASDQLTNQLTNQSTTIQQPIDSMFVQRKSKRTAQPTKRAIESQVQAAEHN